MELSLYHPELGYYARAAQKTGRAGDFFTSVDVGPIFGELLAKQFAEMWRVLQIGVVQFPERLGIPTPFRSRRGRRGQRPPGPRRPRRGRSGQTPSSTPPFASRSSNNRRPRARRSRTRSDRMPACSRTALRPCRTNVHGVIFANELLDALPTHVVVMTRRAACEKCSSISSTAASWSALEELSTPRIAEYLARAGAEMRVGWRAEVNLAAEDWTKRAAASLRRGFMVLIDYGHDEARAVQRVAFGRHADVLQDSTRSSPTFSRSLARPTSRRTSISPP